MHINVPDFLKRRVSFSDSKEKAMLTNIAKLMQVNLTKGMENVQKYNVQINKSENFDITKAFTMIKLKAEVRTCEIIR